MKHITARAFFMALAATGASGCLDWHSLYGETDALVSWHFQGEGPVEEIADLAIRAPNVPLRLSRERDPSKAMFTSEGLRVQGALLETGVTSADALGAALLQAHAVSYEVWFTVGNDEAPGIIFASTGGHSPVRPDLPRGTLMLMTTGIDLRATIDTTLTIGGGERFIAREGQTLGDQAHARVPRLPAGRHHAVVTFDDARHTLTLYLDGQWRDAVDHQLPNQPTGTLRWDSGQNIGVGADPFKGEEWSGVVRRIRIWDRVIEASEVEALARVLD